MRITNVRRQVVIARIDINPYQDSGRESGSQPIKVWTDPS